MHSFVIMTLTHLLSKKLFLKASATYINEAFITLPSKRTITNHKHPSFQRKSKPWLSHDCLDKQLFRYYSTTGPLFATIERVEGEYQQQQRKNQPPLKVNLLTIQQKDLETLLESWKQPKYRTKQIMHWVHEMGASTFDEMVNIPQKLRKILHENASIGSLELEVEVVSKDGTRKRAYRLWDGQLIESVLMPYDDGRQTACISSQAGCAMGCVFCATGQMGFARQLTEDEIFEQVAKFAAELKGENKRLSNVVMMGMGEPLANYRNVLAAVRRMNSDLGIGARKITISTVGVVPNIRKLIEEDIQVRLALSLHCATDEERSSLLPANRRYGGLDELMTAISEYIDKTNRRVTIEWALIQNQNDTPQVARQLGKLMERFGIRKDMVHINVIPLNPTGGFVGSPSGRSGVSTFVNTLDKEFGLKATPRVRRGIDIDAGCGQLKAAVKRKEEKDVDMSSDIKANIKELKSFIDPQQSSAINPTVGIYEDQDDDEDIDMASTTVGVYEDKDDDEDNDMASLYKKGIMRSNQLQQGSIVDFELYDAVNLDEDDDFDDEEYENDLDKEEAMRLISLVHTSFPQPNTEDNSVLSGPTTTISDEDAIRGAKKRRKKLLKNLKAIRNLKELEKNGKTLNEEQREKIIKEEEWRIELESVEHNLQ